jgi:hypothetical protein
VFRTAYCLMLLGLISLAPVVYADTYTLNVSNSNGTGPFGTVTVVQGVDLNTIMISFQLAAGDVYAVTGAGAGVLGFDIDKSFTYVAGSLTSPFSVKSMPASGSFSLGGGGHTDFDNIILCNCGNGTHSQTTTPFSFKITNAGGLIPADIKANADGFFFASDVGTPDGNRGFNTFADGANTVRRDTPTVPEPTSILLFGTALFASVQLLRKKLTP